MGNVVSPNVAENHFAGSRKTAVSGVESDAPAPGTSEWPVGLGSNRPFARGFSMCPRAIALFHALRQQLLRA